MACSEAQLAANRANAHHSTGPRTDAGKASSRWNAWRHGLAGRDDRPGPGEDEAAVEARSKAFAAQLDAPGPVGVELAYRAAVLSLRLRAATASRLVVEDAAARVARERFDADHWDQVAAWTAGLAGPDPLPALMGLETCPEGLDELIPAWEQLRPRVAAAEPEAMARVATWLALRPHERDDLLAQVDAELARLRRIAADPAPLRADHARLRHEAGVIARFDSTPELLRAHRYEVAAERGLFRALSEIRALRRRAAEGPSAPRAGATADLGPDLADLADLIRDLTPVAAPDPAPTPPPPPAPPSPEPGAAPSPTAGLASFRIQRPLPPGIPTGAARDALFDPSLEPIPTRRPRPDLRKLPRKRR